MENGFFIFLVVVMVIGGFIYEFRRNKKRRAAMEALAQDMGFRFDPKKNRSLANQFDFIKHMSKGHSRYAHNILSGQTPDQEPVLIFDFRYTVTSGKNSYSYDYSIFSIKLPRRFPELQIEPEGFGSALKGAIGLGDIDFESIEFSKRYDVRSKDKKFAYDFCHALMIDYLMQNRNFTLEIDRSNLVLIFRERLSTALCKANYGRLLKIRSLMPNYLFS